MKKHNAGSYRLKGNVGHMIVMEAQRTLMGMKRILYMIGCLGLILWVNQMGAPYAPSEYSDSVDKKEYYYDYCYILLSTTPFPTKIHKKLLS